MHLKETVHVLICVRVWLFGTVSASFTTGVLSKSLSCESAFATYHTVSLQMKLNYVKCICYNNANSFSQVEGKCSGSNRNVKQFTTLA